MTKVRHQRSPTKSRPTSPRRVLTIVYLSGAIAAAVGLGWCLWSWYAAPAPPAVSFMEVDPALAEVIQEASREVWWHPHSAAAWARLGQLLRAHTYQPESNFCFTQAERLNPTDPRWPYLQGLSLQSDDPEAAIRHLQRAVDLCGSIPDAPELCLAEVHLQEGHLDDAEQHFRRVLRKDANNARAHLGLGRLALRRGNQRDALAHLSLSKSSKLTQKASCVLLTQVYQQLGDTTAAGKEQVRAADLPNDPPWPDPFVEETWSLRVGKQARLARLTVLRQQGRSPEVRALAAKLEDDYPDVYWLVEGRLQMDKGDLPAAEIALRKAIQLSPDSVDAHFDLGTALFRQNNYRAAAESFRRVTQLEPTYGPAYQNLGRCASALGNRQEAIRAFRVAVDVMPQNAEARRDLGSQLIQEGKVAEAIVQLQQALQLQPGDAKARELLEQALKRAPESGER
jgi:tetratricopeptide (TPR) repeat protein